MVPVRRNLLCALRVLRAEGHLVLWIDALCINQDDNRERGHQVEMMGDIYRKASCVLSWLGTPDAFELEEKGLDTYSDHPQAHAILGFELLDLIYRHPERLDHLQVFATQPFDPFRWPPEESLSSQSFSDHFNQLGIICHVPYWTRLWIIQEVCLARRLWLLYGRAMGNWEAFERLQQKMYRSLSFSPKSQNNWGINTNFRESQPWKLAELRQTYQKLKASDGIPLRTLLEISQNSGCQEHMDHIFGILALTNDSTRAIVSVDYSQPLFRLYECGIRIHVQESPSFERSILAYSNLLAQIMFPAITATTHSYNIVEEHNEARSIVESGALDPPRFRFHGCIIGHLAVVSPEPSDFIRELNHRDFNWEKIVTEKTSRENKIAWINALSAIWREDQFFYRITENITDFISETPKDDQGEGLAIFATEEGDIGICPRQASAGDCLWASFDTNDMLAIFRYHLPSFTQSKVIGKALVAHDGLELVAGEFCSYALPTPRFNITREAMRKSRARVMRLPITDIFIDLQELLAISGSSLRTLPALRPPPRLVVDDGWDASVRKNFRPANLLKPTAREARNFAVSKLLTKRF